MKKVAPLLIAAATLMLTGCTGSFSGLKAIIHAYPTSGTAPLTVSFDASMSTGDIREYDWDFGDGTLGDGPQVVHTYQDPGVYEVTLTVVDWNGFEDSTSIFIIVNPEPAEPVAVIAASGELSGFSDSFLAGELVTFDGSGSYDPDGRIVRWRWIFSDGQTMEGEVVTRWFVGPSCGDPPINYWVELEVEDDQGLRARDSFSFQVIGRCERR